MKFIPSKLIDIIAESYESSENIIDQQGEIYCKTLTDYDSKIYFKNGVKYFGSIENGILNGKGTIVMPNGLKFTGKFINNQIEGRGLLEYSETEYYDGEIQNLQRNGYGLYENKQTGILYKGEWKNDQFHGQGILKIQDQWEYEGQFIDGIKQGQGIVKYIQSQNVFEGNFVNNKKNGYGEMSWKNEKQQYKGNWVDNKLNGFGIYIYKSDFQGKKNLRNYYIGEFVDNNRDGFGIHYYSDSSAYIGFWKDGQKDGKAVFIDNNGFQNLKQFRKNHLIQTQYIQDIGFSDYQIPRIEFIIQETDNWNHEILEKVVKTLNPNLRQIFEDMISTQQPFYDIVKSVSFEKFFLLLKKIRFYDQFINQSVAKDIIIKHQSCYFNVLMTQEEFLDLKTQYQQYIDGKVKKFQLNLKFNEYSTMNYLQFISSIFILLQYKYQNSENIEKDIRNFVTLRLLGILKNKLKIKEWIKDEKLTLMKYKKVIAKSEQKFKNFFESLKQTNNKILLKHLFSMLSQQSIFDFQDKQDIFIFLKVLERNNDPITSCYDELRNYKNIEKFYSSKKFIQFLNQELNYTQLIQNLVLILHTKFSQNKTDIIKNTSEYIENMQFEQKKQKKFTKRYFKQEIVQKSLKSCSEIIEDNIQQQTEEQIIDNQILEEEQQKQSQLLPSQKQLSEKIESDQNLHITQEIDSFADGYFINLESQKNVQINQNLDFLFLTKNFKLQYDNEIFCFNFFMYRYKSIYFRHERKSYTMLEVKLDIQRHNKKQLQKTCYKIFLDRDIQFETMKLSYFNQDFKISTPVQPDVFLPYHIEYRFPEKFYTYKVYVDQLDSSKIECMIIYNQKEDDKILRIYLLSMKVDPNRGFYFNEQDPNELFHVFAYPGLSMGKQIMHAIYYRGEQEKNYFNIKPSFLNFSDLTSQNTVQEQVYEKLKIQYSTQDNRLQAVDLDQSFENVRPIRHMYKRINNETGKLETKIFFAFQKIDSIDQYFFFDDLLFFYDNGEQTLSQFSYKDQEEFHVDSFTFQNFQNQVGQSLQKTKSLPVKKLYTPQYKSFNFPARLQITFNKYLKFDQEDKVKVMAFMDKDNKEFRVATFVKEFKNKALQTNYFPVCIKYDEENKVIRVANETIMYDLNREEKEIQPNNIQFTSREIYKFKNEKPILQLKEKPSKLYLRVSCKEQEPPYNTKIIYLQMLKNNQMCALAFCKFKNDFIVQKQELVIKPNSKNENTEYLVIDIQPETKDVL